MRLFIKLSWIAALAGCLTTCAWAVWPPSTADETEAQQNLPPQVRQVLRQLEDDERRLVELLQQIKRDEQELSRSNTACAPFVEPSRTDPPRQLGL